MTSKREVAGWVVAGIVAMAGLVVVIVGLITPVTASFGWFAYQPLADATFLPVESGVFVSRVTLIGCIVLTIGLLTVAFLAGRRSARR
jgi:heme/copper-type cytochrome/quinol oxidase subunit 1